MASIRRNCIWSWHFYGAILSTPVPAGLIYFISPTQREQMGVIFNGRLHFHICIIVLHVISFNLLFYSGGTLLRVCSVNHLWAEITTHVLTLGSECASLRRYGHRLRGLVTEETMKMTVGSWASVLASPHEPDSIILSNWITEASVCQGPEGIIYSTVSARGPFCNTGHQNLHHFVFLSAYGPFSKCIPSRWCVSMLIYSGKIGSWNNLGENLARSVNCLNLV